MHSGDLRRAKSRNPGLLLIKPNLAKIVLDEGSSLYNRIEKSAESSIEELQHQLKLVLPRHVDGEVGARDHLVILVCDLLEHGLVLILVQAHSEDPPRHCHHRETRVEPPGSVPSSGCTSREAEARSTQRDRKIWTSIL